jgi:hypothetical protein
MHARLVDTAHLRRRRRRRRRRLRDCLSRLHGAKRTSNSNDHVYRASVCADHSSSPLYTTSTQEQKYTQPEESHNASAHNARHTINGVQQVVYAYACAHAIALTTTGIRPELCCALPCMITQCTRAHALMLARTLMHAPHTNKHLPCARWGAHS